MSHNRIREANYRGSTPRKILERSRGTLSGLSSCSLRAVSLLFEKPRERMQTNRSGCRKTTDARATRDFAPVLLCSSREFLSKRETGRMQSCAMSYWFPLQVFPLHIHDPHALRWAIRTPCAS